MPTLKTLILLALSTSLLFACQDDDDVVPPDTPIVYSAEKYDVIVEEDIVYAEGLSHDSINSSSATRLPLKLDVYTPDNDIENRPVYLFIHGGGFIGGSKQQSQILTLANYYTSRGWVFVSIDYRLRDHMGSVPQEWVDYAPFIDNSGLGQYFAIYPAQRDAKAALRWLVANADIYHINTDYITVGGGSAGAITAITLGISNPEDFRDEIDISQDPTLATTHLEENYQIQTIIDLWGSGVALDINEAIYGHHRFDSDDPPLFIMHGTEDPTVPFSGAEELKALYDSTGVPIAYYPIEGAGHGVWNATVNGKRLEKLAFDFIVAEQGLIVE